MCSWELEETNSFRIPLSKYPVIVNQGAQAKAKLNSTIPLELSQVENTYGFNILTLETWYAAESGRGLETICDCCGARGYERKTIADDETER